MRMFFFVDIVSLTDINLGTGEDQEKKIDKLAEYITKSKAYQNAKNPIYLPSGDGAAVCFSEGPERPMDLAIEVYKKIRKYNKGKKKKDQIQVRIGISSGTIFPTKTVEGQNQNYWGQGLISAKRIMDFGDANHILMDYTPAKDLINRTNYYKKIIHHKGTGIAKHEERFQVYSVYEKYLGNSKMPKKLVKSIESKDEHGRLILEGFQGGTNKIMNEVKNYRKKIELTKFQLKRKSRKKKVRGKNE